MLSQQCSKNGLSQIFVWVNSQDINPPTEHSSDANANEMYQLTSSLDYRPCLLPLLGYLSGHGSVHIRKCNFHFVILGTIMSLKAANTFMVYGYLPFFKFQICVS